MGSKKQVDGLDEEIVSWWRLMEEKQSKYISGLTPLSKVPVFEDKLVPVDS